jgi:transcriptional regulator of acetoin/glycerol metabolism
MCRRIREASMILNRTASHIDRIFAVAGDSSASARSAVAASWIRSLQRYGLDPAQAKPPRTLTDQKLRDARDRVGPMLHVAQASLDTLFQAVGSTGCCVLFTDQDGVPVDRRGAVADDTTFHRWGLWPGAVWSEDSEGTNGIGTCIAEERALTIHRDQHFFARNTGLSCSVAPIYDHRGRIAAALDVSSCRADLTEGFVGLIAIAVADAARRIEALNFRHQFATARILLTPDLGRHTAGLLALDRDDMIIGATRTARLAYGITDARLASPLPADSILASTNDRGPDLERAERGALQRALASQGGNVSAAAKALGISRATFHRKMNRLGMHTQH